MNETFTSADSPAPLDVGDPRLALLGALRVPLWVFDVDARRILWANVEGCRFWAAEDVVELRARDLGEMSAAVRRDLERTREDCARTGRPVSEHWTLYPRDTPRSVETVLAPFALDDGRTALLAQVVLHTDGSNSVTLHSAQALHHTPTMVTLHDEAWRLVYANPAARAASPDGPPGLPELLARREDLERVERELATRGECDLEAPVRVAGGAWHAMNVRESRNAVDGDRAILVSAVDVTARRAAEDHVRRLAYRDTLTGLHNRASLVRHLDTRLGANGSHVSFDLLFLDLDRFKRINESLGFAVGDELLVMTACRLERAAGDEGFVGRLGNNEFVIVTGEDATDSDTGADTGADGDGDARPGPADERSPGVILARRVLEAMALPLHVGGHRLKVLPSIGICRHPDHGDSISTLMRNADAAMSTAKRRRLGLCVFDAAMDREVRERHALENDLARALRADELELHYQPRLACSDGRVVGFEALVRWQHPERGLLAPAAFVGLAEESGMIGELGERVMGMAMRQQRLWRGAGYRVGVSINVSPKQFAAQRLPAVVGENLAASACDPSMIELEITESALFEDAESVSETLEAIRGLGVRVAIDDFGTGYSNLARLGSYPLDALKIDRSFVADATQSTLLEAIVAMGRALGLELVAEGIETDEQASRIRGRGCDEMQGYLYSRPLPVEEATRYLTEHGEPVDALH